MSETLAQNSAPMAQTSFGSSKLIGYLGHILCIGMCLPGLAFTVLMLLYAGLIEQSAQLHQSSSFELTDALTSNPQLFAYLGKRVAVTIADTEAQRDHCLFPRRKPGKCTLKIFTK